MAGNYVDENGRYVGPIAVLGNRQAGYQLLRHVNKAAGVDSVVSDYYTLPSETAKQKVFLAAGADTIELRGFLKATSTTGTAVAHVYGKRANGPAVHLLDLSMTANLTTHAKHPLTGATENWIEATLAISNSLMGSYLYKNTKSCNVIADLRGFSQVYATVDTFDGGGVCTDALLVVTAI